MSDQVEPEERHFALADCEAEFDLFGNCPVQAVGTVRGRELYFRARGDEWSLDIADRDGRLRSDGFAPTDARYFSG